VVSRQQGLWLELTPNLWDASEEQFAALATYLLPLTPSLSELRAADTPVERLRIECPTFR